MTENVEGVIAEETTAVESVENQTPEVADEVQAEKVEDEGKDDKPESETQDTTELSEEEIAELEKDPKVKAFLKKKTESQRNALRHSQEAIEKRNDEIKLRDDNIAKQKARIADLEAKQTPELKEDDFDTLEEYEAAKLKSELKDSIRQDEIDDAKAALNAEEAEKLSIAKESFSKTEAEFMKETPEYTENVGKVQDYLNMLPKDEGGVIQDAGAQAGMNYILTESENGAALLNHLGANPDKFEDLLGKPPALIVRKLKAYDKELSAPKTPAPKTDPLPEPITKAKGAASPRVDPLKMGEGDFMKKYLS